MRFIRCLAMMVALPSTAAWAHAYLLQPAPRANIAYKEKDVPCGGAPRKQPVILPSGGKTTVRWTEEIAHPGYYQLQLSPANDANFILIVDQIPNPAGRQDGSLEVTLPNLECEACTLRLIQVMTETAPPSNYYSCADIALRRGSPPAPAPDAGTSTDGGAAADPADGGSSTGTAGSPSDPPSAAAGPEQQVASIQEADEVRAGCSTVEGGALSSAAIAVVALFWTTAGIRRRRR